MICAFSMHVIFVGLGLVGWQLFGEFRSLYKAHPANLLHQLTLPSGITVAEVDNFPVDKQKIILSSYLYKEVSSELHDAGTGAFHTFFLVGVLSLFTALLVRSMSTFDMEFAAIAAVTFGFSEFITLAFVTIRLKFLRDKVRELLK